ncbi:ABC transporter ATP-binding protein [Brachybacterium hainanense]|uniref:ABC transporter ATP-binding protein n=1 Tax=Brachybacterium hainanense TaxID=1541174 RepID=A0ABV6RDM5_9MICO
MTTTSPNPGSGDDAPGILPSPDRSARPATAPPPQHPRVLLPGLARLFRAVWERKLLFAIAILGGIAFALLQIGTSAVIGSVTEQVIVPAFAQGRPMHGAVAIGALAIVGIAVLRAVTVATRRVLTNVGQYDLQREYRQKLSQVFADVPLLWHRRQSTGTLLSSVYADVEATFFSLMPFPFALSTLVMLAYAAVVAAQVSPLILLVMVGMVVLLLALNVLLQSYAAPIAMESQRLRAKVAEIAHESFDGAGVVKSLGREDEEEARFTEAAEQLRRNGIRFGYVRAWFDPMIDVLPNIGILLVVLLGAWRITAGDVTTGEVVQMAYLFSLMALPIRSFGWVLGDLSRTVVGWSRISTVLNVRGRQTYGTQVLPADGRGRLELADVSFAYRDDEIAVLAPRTAEGRADAELIETTALHHVSLVADPAEGSRVLAIVGATGSGKSTLALLAARLVDPGSGTVSLDGADLRTLTGEALTGDVALVLQQAFLFDESVRYNVALGEDFGEEEIRRALRIAQAEEFVDALPEGLDTVLGERGGSLSGGQRQRIALARALVRRPRLLILDDATSACDPSVEEAILAGIRTHMTDSTLLLVAYRKSTISIADRVVFLEDGRVAGAATHAELRRTHAAYRALVDAYDEAAISHSLLEAGEDA